MYRHIKSLYRYREIIINLTVREIQSRYKQSLFGKLWIILHPLSLMAIYTIVFSKIARLSSDNIPYPLFVYSGLVAWNFFASSLVNSIYSLVQNVNLIKKVYFPREIFPLTSLCSATVDFLVALVVFLGLLVFYGIPMTWNMLFVIPILLIQAFLIIGLSLLI